MHNNDEIKFYIINQNDNIKFQYIFKQIRLYIKDNQK